MVQEYNILDCATGFAITRLTAGSWGEILEKSYASQKILRPGVRFFQMRKIFFEKSSLRLRVKSRGSKPCCVAKEIGFLDHPSQMRPGSGIARGLEEDF